MAKRKYYQFVYTRTSDEKDIVIGVIPDIINIDNVNDIELWTGS